MTSTANDYDSFAQDYANANESNVYNALYERPAVLSMLGDVSGCRVLDAGCGAGAHAAALIERGATVEGLDLSAGLLAIARRRLGPDVSLRQADLSQPLPCADNRFDAVLASLVLHYLEDWVPTLREFHRVLVRSGRIVVSTGHPFMDFQSAGSGNYLATEQWEDHWSQPDGGTKTMRFWRRPLSAMIEAFQQAGFRIDAVREPEPLAEARERFPTEYQRIMTRPSFLFFAATAVD
jgi:ubiquinone/menaquinone biosynthesis C-methylase UbiE